MCHVPVFPLEGFSGKAVGLAVWAEPPESALRMHLALCPNRRQQWAFAEDLAEEQKDTGPCPLEACSLVGGTPPQVAPLGGAPDQAQQRMMGQKDCPVLHYSSLFLLPNKHLIERNSFVI